LALKHHVDPKVRFDQQVENAATYVLPFIEQTKPIAPGTRVFEVGTAEGGVLLPFIERGCSCVGVDLNEARIEQAKIYLAKEVAEGKVEFIYQNIYDDSFVARTVAIHNPLENIPSPRWTDILRISSVVYAVWRPPAAMPQKVGKCDTLLPHTATLYVQGHT
jgi:SAM-dependent methyltransferase